MDTTLPTKEVNNWINARLDMVLSKMDAMRGAASAPVKAIGKTTSVDTFYPNQQADTSLKKQLDVDGLFALTKYDQFDSTDLDGNDLPRPFPVTEETENYIKEAAKLRLHTTKETLPIQRALDAMESSRKAHLNWGQRKQQLLTYRQLLAVNGSLAEDNFNIMVEGGDIDIGDDG